jgi:hypothetical protein
LEELPAEEALLLEEHLTSCPACRSELGKLQALHRVVAEHRPVRVEEHLLEEARRQRRIALREETERRPLLSALVGQVREFLSPPVRLALGGALVLGLGIFLGRSVIPPEKGGRAAREGSLFRTAALGPEESVSEPAVRDLQFHSRNEESGNVEISFEAVSRIRMRGNIHDESIQRVLARSLMAEKNPGTRLRTVNLLTARAAESTPISAEVKAALIAALKGDANPAVRKEALESLIPYLPDDEVTRAFVHILSHDQNTGLRIASIKALDAAALSGQPAYLQVREALEDAARSDANKFIRIKAQQAIEEKTP